MIQPGAQRMYWSVAKIYSCPVHTSVPRHWANTNETEQTTPKSKTNTANRRTKTKTDKEKSSNGATNITLTSLHKKVWIAPAKGTGVMQNILGLATPVKGFPKGNCPASERKPRSSAQKRLDRTKRKSTRSRKGAQTTARPLLVNACLTGETCAKNFADTCYTASGSRAESQPQPIKRIIKQSERVGHRMRYAYFPKQELKFMHPENMFRSFFLDGWSDRVVRWVNVRF